MSTATQVLAKHILDNWTPALESVMNDFGDDDRKGWEKIMSQVDYSDMRGDKQCVAGAGNPGRYLFYLLGQTQYPGSDKIMGLFKQMVPHWKTLLKCYTGPPQSPTQERIVEKRVEVPVERIVEKRVEVPVERIVYVQSPSTTNPNEPFDLTKLDNASYDIHRFLLKQDKPITKGEFFEKSKAYPNLWYLVQASR